MNITIKPHDKFASIYRVNLGYRNISLATLNFVPGQVVYGEQLVENEGKEFRLWDPFRSKLAAAVHKGLSSLPIKPGGSVLYLGAATGTTLSHISDIVGAMGRVYAVEFSPRSMRELIINVSCRVNVFPILADARFPWNYRLLVEKVDVIYCDIAQPEQARILADNTDMFLRKEGSALLAIKARSIDSTIQPKKVFQEQVNLLKYRRLHVEEIIPLNPYDKDHVMVLAKK